MSIRFDYPIALIGLLIIPLLVAIALQGIDRQARGRRIIAAAVRGALVLAAILALAGPAIVRTSDHLATIFLVDASDSMGLTGITTARDYVKGALATMPAGDRAGIVVFGGNALVERSVSEDPDLGPLLSKPQTGQSDLAGAVRLGLALFPEGYTRRIVLISDGQQTVGDLVTASNAAAASGIEISTRTITNDPGDETLVSEVRAPARAREGEALDIFATVQSTRSGPAQLRLFGDGDLILEQTTELKIGDNSFRFTIPPINSGFHRFRVEVKAPSDTYWQNNTAAAFTEVKGRAHILILEGVPDDGANLAAALRASGYVVDQTTTDRMPVNLAELVQYDAILLVNTPAEMLGTRMALLQSYVRDLGRGLIVVGGEKAYGPGGYAKTTLEEILPVRMELRNGVITPPVSLVFAIDKSGSMASGSGTVTQMDLAKEAAYRAVKLLQPQDEIGIVAFDDSAYVVAPRKPLNEYPDIANRIGTLQSGGGTDIRAGLEAALNEQAGSSAKVRHIILVTDGQSANNFADLVVKMNNDGITLSVIGVGTGVAAYLPQLAASGNGRYYYVSDPTQLPEIFLKETRLALRSYFIEGDIEPRLGGATPITEGFTNAPHLKGYVGTTAKPTAVTGLVSSEGDPLLAQWQYGLGRVVAWTSDAKGQWAVDWLPWGGFTNFWARTVGWTISAPPQDLQLHTTTEAGRTQLTVDAVDAGGAYRNGLSVVGTIVGPDGTPRDITLQQTAPGRYAGDLGLLNEGAHLLAVVARDGSGTPQAATSGGVIVPYSPEYALPRADRATALAQARELTGGNELSDPATVFAHTLPPAQRSQPIWPPLLILAICILPFDIAFRRLIVSRHTLQTALARLPGFWRHSATTPTTPAPSTPTMSNLLAARERFQQRWDHTHQDPPREQPAVPKAAPPSAPQPRPTPPPAPPVARSQPLAPPPPAPTPTPRTSATGSGTLGQLLKAKEDARRRQ